MSSSASFTLEQQDFADASIQKPIYAFLTNSQGEGAWESLLRTGFVLGNCNQAPQATLASPGHGLSQATCPPQVLWPGLFLHGLPDSPLTFHPGGKAWGVGADQTQILVKFEFQRNNTPLFWCKYVPRLPSDLPSLAALRGT